jgi:hypothetical protein
MKGKGERVSCLNDDKVKPTKLTTEISIVKTGSTRMKIFHTDIGDMTSAEMQQAGFNPKQIYERVRDKGWQHKDIFREGHLPRAKEISIIDCDVSKLGCRPRLKKLADISVGSYEASL